MKEDVMLDQLKQVNISKDAEKTKERVQKTWDGADKKNRQKLIDFTGKSMYHNLTRIKNKGAITAKMTILLSRYLNVNPFYLTGEEDKHGRYSDDVLKDFLDKLGYKKLWTEYSKYSDKEYKEDELNGEIESEQGENIEQTEETREFSVGGKNKTENEILSINTDKSAVTETHSISIETETLNILSKLTDDETITLLRALLIRAKVPDSNSKEIADKIKLKLLLN